MTNERRYDLDWLRILAFAVLILYHVGMFYVTWDWHVKSSRASHAIEPLMRLVNPWRLSLLFLISGAATRYLADNVPSARAFAWARLRRLGPPPLLAMFVIVPPQSYYEIVEAMRALPASEPQQSWLQHFYLKYVSGSGHWCDEDGCLITPTYNHMWFVVYLILYSLALSALLPTLRRYAPRLAALRTRLLEGPGLIIVPWAVMLLLRATLRPMFGETHVLWNDGYLHPLCFSLFLFGFAVAKAEAFFRRCKELRWIALVAVIVAWGALETGLRSGLSVKRATVDPSHLIAMGVVELQAWAAILACVGFAHRHLRGIDNNARRVLTEAILPFYLVHQTIIVVLAHHLDPLQLPLPVEASVLIMATGAGCWLFYDGGRRIAELRSWIGLNTRSSRSGIYKAASNEYK